MTVGQQTAEQKDARKQLRRAIARIQAGVLALVFGFIGACGLFLMTAVLLIDGGPNAGFHLQLLGNYFVGYTVTWPGAFVGAAWAFIACGIIGWAIGLLYNRIVAWRSA